MRILAAFLGLSLLTSSYAAEPTLQAGLTLASKKTQVASSQSVVAKRKKIHSFVSDQVVALSPQKQSFSVTLSSNPTTGYSWYLLKYNSHLILPASAEFIPPKNKKLMGAPGSMRWTFSATDLAMRVPNITHITLLYARPWDLADARAYRILVTTNTL